MTHYICWHFARIDAAMAYIRPHDVIPAADDHGAWRIERIAAMGANARIMVSRPGLGLEAVMGVDAVIAAALQPGQQVALRILGGVVVGGSGEVIRFSER